MTNMSLLQFILSLLGNEEARAEFNANPQQTLSENGFDNLCGADVRDARPLIVDNVQTAQNNSFDRELSGGGNSTHVHHTPPPPPPPAHDDDGMDGAIREINYITQHYSWSDSHNTVLDNSVNQNIWADGDVLQWFDNDPVVASGDGAVAAGDDVDGTVTTGDRNVVGHGNDVNHVGSAAADNGGAVAIGEGSASGDNDASDHSTDVDAYGSGNVAVASNGSETEQRDSHDTDNSIDDSYNSESETNTDNSIDDSYNTDTETNTDNSVDVDDSYNSETETNTDNSVDVADSYNSESETNASFESTEVETTVTNTDNSINGSYNDTAVASNNELDVEDVVVIG
jgi:hypothetical protein